MEIERFTPGAEGEIWYEHWHRYHFAAPLAGARRVLDVACGEGYGSALLARRAASVIGVDADDDTVVRARRRYGGEPGLEFRAGRCEALPVERASVDLVVSFETLEHIAEPARLVDEAARVLAPGGLFLVSTPNKAIYSDRTGYRNPFHLHELYRDEFFAMVNERFPHAAFFGQRVDAYSAIWPLSAPAARAELFEARRDTAENAAHGSIADPMYFIALCGREAAAVEAAGNRFSLLSDAEHGVSASFEAIRERHTELSSYLAGVEAAFATSQEQLAALAQERDRLAARVRQLEAQAAPARPRG